MNIVKKAALHFARKKFCKTAIEEQASLRGLREKPTLRMIVGMGLILFSYVIGLPAVIALGIIAIWMKEPLLGVIGAPVTYAVSTVIFIIGIHLAGRKLFVVFSRWAARVILEKILGKDVRLVCSPCPEDKCSP